MPTTEATKPRHHQRSDTRSGPATTTRPGPTPALAFGALSRCEGRRLAGVGS